MAIITYPVIDAPTTEKSQGSVLDSPLVRVIDVPSFAGVTNNAGLFTTNSGGPIRLIADICASPINKTFDIPAWATAHMFGMYRGFMCKAVGYDREAQLSAAGTAFSNVEGRGFEQVIGTILMPYATRVTVPTSTTPKDAFTALMKYVRANYSGNVIVVMTIDQIVSIGPSPLIFKDINGLHTIWGDDIVISASFTGTQAALTGGTPAAGTSYMLAFGALTLLRTPLEQHQTMNQSSNDVLTLVERAYAAAVDSDFIAVVLNGTAT